MSICIVTFSFRRLGQVKTIKLKADVNNKPKLTDSEISDLFQPADIPSQPEQPVVSTLAMQLEEDGISIDSLFSEYARFNGEYHEGQDIRHFTVFLTMLWVSNSITDIIINKHVTVIHEHIIGMSWLVYFVSVSPLFVLTLSNSL
jgi:hypothetical protein